jgi:DNA-binding transcriptional ArsR family regulator
MEAGGLTSGNFQTKLKCSWVGRVEAKVLEAVRALALRPGSPVHYLDVVVWICGHSPDPKCRRSVLEAIRRLAKRGYITTIGRGRGLYLKLLDDLDPASSLTSYSKRSAFRCSISVRHAGARPRDGYWGLKTKILRFVYEHKWGEVRVRDLVRTFGISDRTIRYHLKTLHELGLVDRPKKGLVKARWLSCEEINRILSEAGELAPVLEVIGLKCDYQDLKEHCKLKPFTVKHALFATDYSRRHLQREFSTLVDKGVLIELGGRSCPRKKYIINPAYPQKIPRHVHTEKVLHSYGGSRIWRRSRKTKHGITKRDPKCHRCGRVERGILGDGDGCGGSC